MLRVICAAGVLIHSTLAQTSSEPINEPDTASGPATAAETASPSPSASNPTEGCSWDGSVSDYLTCQKDNVSTSTLIGAGIGVTVAILLLVGVCVWFCHRQQSARYPSKLDPTDAELTAVDKTAPRRPHDSDDSDVDSERPPIPEVKRKRRASEAEASPLPIKGVPSLKTDIDPRAVRVDSASSSSDVSYLTPPPPHPAHAPKLSLPSGLLGSPVEHDAPRKLYPTNPSPAPRQLQSSVYSKRQSVASVRTARLDDTTIPPVPPAPARSGTAPLNIRKSTYDVTTQPSRRPSGAVPSYYEATRGEPASRPVSRAARAPMSTHATSSSAPDAPPPPVPLAGGPLLDARRPSALGTQAQGKGTEGPRRGSAERGGMI